MEDLTKSTINVVLLVAIIVFMFFILKSKKD